jgi:hypothetical protein
MKPTIVIWDSDSLAYRAAAATETRSVEVLHVPTGKTKVFKNRTECKDRLKALGKEFDPEVYKFKDIQEPEPLSHTIKIMNSIIEKTNEKLFADEYLLCIEGKNNFRATLPYPSAYKGNRTGIRPLNLKPAKLSLYKNHPNYVAQGFEVDDAVIFKGYEYLDKGYNVILASQDKDAMSASGLSLYDFTKEDAEVETIPDFGYLLDEGKKVSGKGFIWLCYQIVRGDVVDNLNPSEIARKKFGDKSAYYLLKDAKDKMEALELVKKQYKDWYGNGTKYIDCFGVERFVHYDFLLDLYFKGVKMMEKEGEIPCAYKFFESHGVQLP